MAVPYYGIGPMRFLNLTGSPILPENDIIVDTRPGVDGMQFTQTGQRGKPFTMLSRLDVASYEAGITYFSTQYLVCPLQGLLDLVINDFAYSTINMQVEVLRVRLGQRGCFRAYPIVNGLASGSTHLLEAEWDLALLFRPS